MADSDMGGSHVTAWQVGDLAVTSIKLAELVVTEATIHSLTVRTVRPGQIPPAA